MAELHDALKVLGPIDWNDVPTDNLEQFMTDCFTAGELICNSVPPMPDGTPFNASKPYHDTANSATSRDDIHPSAARAPPPHSDHEALQKHWGKPMRFNAKQNPLKISLYKMAGHDRHGAWFARRCVTEGLGFAKFKAAMMREFAETMTVTGGPGAGAIRGLGADRRLERIDVPGKGKLEVFQLSAQFPGPVTPRDFMTLLLSGDDTLSEKSAAAVEGSSGNIPRHFMVVSKPVEHPDAPIRSGFVRGHYESVEMIREIPLSPAKAKSTSDLLTKTDGASKGRERGHTVGPTASESTDAISEPTRKSNAGTSPSSGDPELNPVEWIMITRSDPGGGIPRFLVERGTPETMLEDVHKFFNWACAQDHILHPDDESAGQAQTDGAPLEQTNGEIRDHSKPSNLPVTGSARAATEPSANQQTSQGGILSNISNAIGAGFDAYAPTSVSNMVHSQFQTGEEISEDSSSDTSSIDSFLSAEEMRRVTTAEEALPTDSVDALSIASGNHSETTGRPLSRHEKEVQKLAKKREKLDQQLAKKRMAEEQKLREAQEKDQTEAEKAKEKLERDLKKTEERHRKEVEKLEARKAKEARKAEEKRNKKDEQNKLSLVSRERDDFRGQADLFRRENSLLREQVAELQAQNTKLSIELGKHGGQDVLRSLSDEFGHRRTGSTKSTMSGSSESVAKNVEKKVEAAAQ